MENFINFLKVTFAAVGAFLSAKLGILLPVLVFLLVMMVIDYISGMIASANEGTKNPTNSAKGLNSKKGLLGILKKIGYVIIVVIAMILDWLILNIAGKLGFALPFTTCFGLLVAIWFILNEILSTIENVGRMGVPMPPFLKKAVAVLKNKVEDIGDKQINNEDMEVEKHE